ncbi:FecR domain-containing protein [Sphingomonas sp. KR3-1]|uniref:FecR family protein n=1 Tax=Sphingomonas sp. KR3-1 TaxID=3156611 RepID=UPI0032B52514
MTDRDAALSHRNALLSQGLDHVLRLASGNATEGDARLLRDWRAASPENDAAFVEAARLWRNIGKAAVEEQAGPAELVSIARARWSRRRVIGGGLATAAAASVAMVVLLPDARAGDLVSAKGSRRRFQPVAGVLVDLNTDSRLRPLDMAGADAQFELIRGEVLLSTSRPVRVRVASVEAATQRGRFNVRRDGAACEIACVSETASVRDDTQTVVLAAGQSVRHDGTRFEPRRAADLTVTTAWRDGLLVFRDRALSDVVHEINRYRPGRVIVASSTLGARRLNGVFHLGDMDAMLAEIRRGTGASITRLPGGIVILD